jgi:prepilin-type N-terminal cleavage/methylation domain-containing protein
MYKHLNRKHIFNYHHPKTSEGFTLIELLVGIVITSIISILALQALSRTQNSFYRDQKKVEFGQRNSSILEMIGREIRQAGELINEAEFPAVKIQPLNSGGSSIVLYYASSEPASICQDYPAGFAPPSIGGVPALLFYNDTATASSPCKLANSSVSTTDKFPPKQKIDWMDKRSGGSLFAVVYSPIGLKVQPFVYTSEVSQNGANSMNIGIGTNSSFILSSAIKKDDTMYLVTKKEYMVCGTDLKVRINSKVESTNAVINPACATPDPIADSMASLDTIATNITSLDITTITRAIPDTTTADPIPTTNVMNTTFPFTDRGWKNLQGVKIAVKPKEPIPGETAKVQADLISEGTFFPRNALSTK